MLAYSASDMTECKHVHMFSCFENQANHGFNITMCNSEWEAKKYWNLESTKRSSNALSREQLDPLLLSLAFLKMGQVTGGPEDG